MGLKMTLEKFLWHLFTEPAVAVQGLTHSIKDIIEILYFYFTELSLTACYVILFILAVRFLLRNAPKVYSYALWGVVYFKLISVLKLDFFRRSLIPQPRIDKIYYDITPHYTAFYSTEAGIVSQVQSEFVTPVPVVTPIYTPALIWAVVLCGLFAVSMFTFFSVYVKLRNSNCENTGENVYVSDAISTPFVLGIIRPKIYLPKGLSEQYQNYVVTHEKVHIRRGDHIVKLFAFAITCIHWFNPLVWLSFFLLEKDMEMSCDEKVLQILGNEHKKDYSYCILSLAVGRRFVPKAYLSFGDSDTQKRIKNVLNYKKPAVIASVLTIIGVIVITVGMLADSGVIYVPNKSPSNNENGIMENNFPNGFDTFFFTFNGYSTSVKLHMPEGWSFEQRNIQTDEYPKYLTLDDNFSNSLDIYNHKGENVGAMGIVSYTEYLGQENNLMAIYGAVALPNMYNFNVNECYSAVNSDKANGNWESATTKVYHSPQINRDLGLKEETTYGDGILAYNRECLVFVAIEFEEDYFSDGELEYIAQSLQIKPENSSFGTATALLNMHYRNIETDSNFDISEYASEDVLSLLNAKKEIAKHRQKIFGMDKQSYSVQVIPFEMESWIENENSAVMKMQIIRTWRYNTANSDSSSSEVVTLQLDRTTNGNFIVTDYRIYGKDLTFNNMDADYWKALENGNSKQYLDDFVKEYKSFISNKNNSVLAYIPADGNKERIETIRQMCTDGKTESEIIEFSKKELISRGLKEEELKTLTHLSFHPIEIYCMEDSYREQFIKDTFEQLKASNQPGGSARMLMYEELASQVFDSYKNNSIVHDNTFAKAPEDFVYPEMIHWGETKFVQDEMGYFNASIPSVDGKYRMSISVSDFTYDNERPFDSEPTVNYVAFFEN